MFTAVVGVAISAGLLQNAAAALGALAGHLDDQGLGKRTLRIARTGQEAAEAAGLDDHLLAAHVAHLVGQLVRHLDALAVQILLRLVQLRLEASIELPQQILPVLLALFYLVQIFLHPSGERRVDHVMELVLHQPGDHFAQRRRTQGAPFLDHILPGEDDGHGGGVGGGTADALFFQGLDEGGLGVPSGGLGEVLLLVRVCQLYGLALAQIGQGGADGRFALLLGLHVHRGEACKFQAGVGGAEQMGGGGDVDGHAVIPGVCHLAGDEPAPDELVQLVLLRCQALAHGVRVQVHVSGTDGLVGVLSAGLGLEGAGGLRIELGAVVVDDIGLGRLQRIVREPQGVGTHIGDKTNGALTGDVDALVELLGDGHGAAGSHVQLPAGLLLEGGGGEGGRRLALLLRPADAGDHKGIGLDVLQDGVHLLLIGKLRLLLALPVVMSLEPAGQGGDAV